MSKPTLRCHPLPKGEQGDDCCFAHSPSGASIPICIFDGCRIEVAPCRNLEKLKLVLRSLCEAVGLEVVEEDCVAVPKSLALRWFNECRCQLSDSVFCGVDAPGDCPDGESCHAFRVIDK